MGRTEVGRIDRSRSSIDIYALTLQDKKRRGHEHTAHGQGMQAGANSRAAPGKHDDGGMPRLADGRRGSPQLPRQDHRHLTHVHK
jgi:hypothetical protein